MKSLKPDNNKNCINIGSDVYVLEKEGSYRKRCATHYLDSNKEINKLNQIGDPITIKAIPPEDNFLFCFPS